MLVVAPLAQCLVILWIPKQFGVALVWCDVVDNSRFDGLAKVEVHHA